MNDLVAKGTWSTAQRLLHINLLEMMAVKMAVLNWESALRHKSILVATDNTTVLAYLNHQGGTQSRKLTKLAVQILTLIHSWGSVLRTRHIAAHSTP